MKVTCDCGSVMVVNDRRFGSVVRCPRCGADVTVTSPDGPPPPPLPAATQRGWTAAAEPPQPPQPPQRKRWTEPPNLPPEPVAPLSASVPVTVAPSAATSPAPLSSSSIASAPPAPSPPPASATPADDTTDNGDIEPPPLPSALPGVEPSVEWRRSSLHLAIALALIGLFTAAPAVVHLIQNSPLASMLAMAMPRWVAFLLLVAGIHIAYAFYVAQLPDWSTVWVVAITMLALATMNSVMLAVTLLGSPNASLVRLLELHDYLRGGRAAGWCFIMLCLSVTVAYCAGRMAARWHTAETARLQALHIID